jgi:opacity protein-like surface antigen
MRPSKLLPALMVSMAVAAATPVFGQQPPTVAADEQAETSYVRTIRDQVMVWRRNPSQMIAVLPEGVELEALSSDQQWYEVRVPERYAGAGGAVGYVYKGHVELLGPPPPERPALEYEDLPPETLPPDGRFRTPPPAFGVRGYGRVGWEWFLASDSFDAVLGQTGGVFYGGGGQVIFRRLFVDVSVERFEKTGERVFVFEGEVFPLGIPDTITMTPVTVSAGWRFTASDDYLVYVGGGAGSVRFQEVSDFAEPGENVDERFTSYHGLVGVEYAATRWLFVASEFRFTSVPDSLGAPGVSGAFDEDNLGGYGLVLKVLVGR